MSYDKFAIIKKLKVKKTGLETKNLKEVIKELKREGYIILHNDFGSRAED